MAESTESLTQRVEALEQISHARVIERVGQVEQRVSRIESAREAEEPHVATKADVARLETLIVGTRSDLQEQISETRSDLQEQISETRSDLQEQISETRSDLREQIGETRSDLREQIGETRSDLQEQISETRSDLREQISETRSDLLRQMSENHSDMEDKINAANTAGEKRLRHFLMWLIGTAIAFAAVIIAAFAAIVGQLP